MSIQFQIPSSDPALLQKAARVAREFVQPLCNDSVVGIVFLGAIARGYFDRHADIDIAIFKQQAAQIPLPEKFQQVDGIEVQVWLSDYESELSEPWDMPRRWTYSQRQIYYDPQGKIARLLDEKVPLKPEESKWLMMAGLTLSEWYVNDLTQLWVERGSLVSAHAMFNQGLRYFYEMLFGLNHQLVADTKWLYYCVEQMERLPGDFQARIQEIMLLHAFSLEELERRREAFMGMWQEMRPVIEAEVCLSYEEMVQIV